MKRKKRNYECSIVELDDETDALVMQKIQEAEEDIAKLEVQVTFRWNKGALDLVKRAAASRGLSYKEYMKQVLYEKAQADLPMDPQER